MTTKTSVIFPKEDSYNLLDELLHDDYDKFEEFDDEYNGCNGLKSPQKKLQKEKLPLEKETNSSYLETNKKEHVVNTELDIEDGEIIDNVLTRVEVTSESGPVEITSMFNSDKMLGKAFHENFQGKHLILKIYENCSSCPFCKLILRK